MGKIQKLFLTGFILRFILSFSTWHPDLNNHVDWGIRFWQYGPAFFYKANVWNFTWPNQPPGTMYLFALVRKLFELVFNFFWFINIHVPAFPSNIMIYFQFNLYQEMLKLPAIFCDIGIAYIIYKILSNKDWFKGQNVALYGAALYLFNPAIWYNSSIWGQTDSIINFFAFLSFYLLLKRKLTSSVLFLALSFYIKASLLIFLPIFAIAAFKQKFTILEWTKAIVLTVVVVGVATLPFSKTEPFGWLYKLYVDKVFGQQLEVITANAFNLWAAIAGIHEKPQTLLLGPLSYQIWGEILFAIFYLPILYFLYKTKQTTSVFWALALSGLASFILLTNMHERYLYPAFPALTILVAQNRKLIWSYFVISAIYVLNLYNFWWYPRIEVFVDILSAMDRLLPRILGFINFVLFLWLYSKSQVFKVFSKHITR
jgi:Gpi18-like mannosyltransferase